MVGVEAGAAEFVKSARLLGYGLRMGRTAPPLPCT